jgi:hypothetical protein
MPEKKPMRTTSSEYALRDSEPVDKVPDHWTNPDSLIGKLAKLCKMSVPTVRAALPMRIPLADLKTYDDAEVARHFGCITEPQWREWCYLWRDSAFRFSDLGEAEAQQHARENDLPLSQSDQPVSKEPR